LIIVTIQWVIIFTSNNNTQGQQIKHTSKLFFFGTDFLFEAVGFFGVGFLAGDFLAAVGFCTLGDLGGTVMATLCDDD